MQLDMFRRCSILMTILLIFSISSYGGENLVIEKMEELPNDLYAKMHPVKDRNGKPCALLKIWVKDKISGIQGNNIGAVEKTGLENWVSLTDGSKEIKLMFENHFPLHVVFNQFGLDKLHSKRTYLLIISDPDGDSIKSPQNSESSNITGGSEEFEKGLQYFYGRKKKRDDDLAKQMFFKAADKGNPDAMYYIGMMYRDGVGVEKNLKTAFKWFSKASEFLHPDAMYELGNLYLDDKIGEKDPDLAFSFFSYSANAGNTKAMLKMAYYYKKGIYVDQDYGKAVALYQEAADRGDAIGQYNLALQYVKGEGVSQDLKKAFKWFEKSALLGDSYAQYNLGVMYEKGLGCEADLKKAIYFYKKASEQGHDNATMALLKLGAC